MPSSKWRSERSGPNWLMDEQGRLIGYRDEQGNEYKMPSEPVPGGVTDSDEPASSVSGAGIQSGGVAFAGDSWFAQWLSGNRTTQFYRAADCSIAHACQLLNYGFRVIGAGVGGNTSQMIRGRFQADVLDKQPRDVVIGATINDPLNDVPTATSIANYSWMIEQCLSRGIRVRIHNVPPTAAAYMNASRWALLYAINRWISFVLPTLYPSVSILDRFSLCVDPTANPTNVASGTYKDSLHYASALAFKIGKADADYLGNFYAPGSFAATTVGDNIVNLAGSRVLNQYALFQGSGGTTGTGVTGTVATGVTVKRNAGAGAGVASVVAHDVAGNWQQVAITGAGATDVWQVGPSTTISSGTAGLVAGGSYYWECEVDVSNISGLNEVYLFGNIVFDTGSGNNTYQLRDNSSNSGGQAGTTTPYRKMLRTEVFTIPANAVSVSSMDIQVFAPFATGASGGTATIKVGRMTPVALQ